MRSLSCLFGHKWTNELGGHFIDTTTGESICYRCGYQENQGQDPASWFDYPAEGIDSYGTLNPNRVPGITRE